MKNVVTTTPVDLALRTLGPEEARQVHAWFDHLANWDGDPFVRENSHALAGVPGVLVLRTSSDIRIFLYDLQLLRSIFFFKLKNIILETCRNEYYKEYFLFELVYRTKDELFTVLSRYIDNFFNFHLINFNIS